VESYEEVLRQARRYREQLLDYLRPHAATPEWFTRLREHPELLVTEENQMRWEKIRREEGERAVEKKIFTWEPIAPLDLSALPRLHIELSGLVDGVEQVAGEFLLLGGIPFLLLVLSGWRVLRYPVR